MKPFQRAIAAGLILISALVFVLSTSFGQPAVDSSKPSVTDAKRALQTRIEQQSAGRISLVDFRMTVGKSENMEVDGKRAYYISFEAGIEFGEPCKWYSSFDGKPLTFFTFKPQEPAPSSAKVSDVSRDISEKGARYVLQGSVLLISTNQGWIGVGFGSDRNPQSMPELVSQQCVNNLKQIGLALKTWALDNDDKYPFAVGTGKGGTMELRKLGDDGYDQNSAAHFQVMSNELSTAKLLICPADTSKHLAGNFANLQSENVSYVLRTGPNVNDDHPDEVMVICPIHGNALYADGRVEVGKKK